MNGKVFVDSSVWIAFFREANGKARTVLQGLLEDGRAVIGKIVAAEILPFVKKDAEQKKIRGLFEEIETLPFHPEDWDALITWSQKLCRKGLTPSIPDLVVATLCLKDGSALYTLDGHFKDFSKIIPLPLFDGE